MTVLTDAAIAALFGGLLSAGLLCVLASVPRWRAAPLAVRIGPYLRDVVPEEALPHGVAPRAGVLPTGLWQRMRAGFAAVLAGGEVLRLRLAQAGSELDAATFRGRQLSWTLAGAGAGAVLLIALALAGRGGPATGVLPLLGAAAVGLGYDAQLTARARARQGRLADELPTTLEFLALCLSAGESVYDALRRVGEVGSGELTAELRQVSLAVHTGSSLADALTEAAGRLQVPGLSRAVDQVVAALEHGAPLAGVLHAQASDAREDAKRVLIEQAGRKEIAMMLPVVFLLLPISVLFAVYPGLFVLRLGIG